MVNKLADKKARKLAKMVLGKDWDLLMKQKYIVCNIKIKFDKKISLKRMVISKDINLYGYDKKREAYFRYCSELTEESAMNPYRNHYGPYMPEQYSKYDRLIAFYIWLKHYKKHPISPKYFAKKFNLIGGVGGNTLKDIISGYAY